MQQFSCENAALQLRQLTSGWARNKLLCKRCLKAKVCPAAESGQTQGQADNPAVTQSCDSTEHIFRQRLLEDTHSVAFVQSGYFLSSTWGQLLCEVGTRVSESVSGSYKEVSDAETPTYSTSMQALIRKPDKHWTSFALQKEKKQQKRKVTTQAGMFPQAVTWSD